MTGSQGSRKPRNAVEKRLKLKKGFSFDYSKLFNLTVFNNDRLLNLRWIKYSAEIKYPVMVIINQVSIQNGPNYVTVI